MIFFSPNVFFSIIVLFLKKIVLLYCYYQNMKKLYYIPFLFLLLIISSAKAQDVKQQSKIQEATIEGLSLYPNPITNGKVYIATKNDSEKEIQIFDVLGKKVFHTQLNTRELNISSLSPGVYIIKIREEESTATRKLIIR